MKVNTILYVANQRQSLDFYAKIIGKQPELDVPGMTEFLLSESHVLGLMPNAGIKKLLGDKIPNPELGFKIPRVEIYFKTPLAKKMFELAIQNGAHKIDEFCLRDWGDSVGYAMDSDCHLLAFAYADALGTVNQL